MRRLARTFSQTFPENFATSGHSPMEKLWRSEPGDSEINGSGDLLAMMVESGRAIEDEECERRTEERAAEPPPRKAIISIHGKDVEECEIPKYPRRRRAA